jgi:hypothetical protein
MLTEARVPFTAGAGRAEDKNVLLVAANLKDPIWAVREPSLRTPDGNRSSTSVHSDNRRSRSEVERLIARRLRAALFPDGYL